MTTLSFEHHFRPSDRELSRVAALRYARGGALRVRSRRQPSSGAPLRGRRSASTRPAISVAEAS